jgi:hypothetical protein
MLPPLELDQGRVDELRGGFAPAVGNDEELRAVHDPKGFPGLMVHARGVDWAMFLADIPVPAGAGT